MCCFGKCIKQLSVTFRSLSELDILIIIDSSLLAKTVSMLTNESQYIAYTLFFLYSKFINNPLEG